MNKDVFRKFEQRARPGVLSDDELKRYERSLKVYRDNLAVEEALNTASEHPAQFRAKS